MRILDKYLKMTVNCIKKGGEGESGKQLAFTFTHEEQLNFSSFHLNSQENNLRPQPRKIRTKCTCKGHFTSLFVPQIERTLKKGWKREKLFCLEDKVTSSSACLRLGKSFACVWFEGFPEKKNVQSSNPRVEVGSIDYR